MEVPVIADQPELTNNSLMQKQECSLEDGWGEIVSEKFVQVVRLDDDK